MKRIVCDVRRNELYTQRLDYPPWEVPIVELIHSTDGVVRIDEIDVPRRVLEPEAEYQRLERRYGLDKETHQPRVGIVYGPPPLGIERLAAAMKEALDEQAELDRAAAEEQDAEPPAPSEPDEPVLPEGLDGVRNPRRRRRASE